MYKLVIFDFFEVIHQDPLEILLTKNGYQRREGPYAEVCAEMDLGKITYGQYVERLAELMGHGKAAFEEMFHRLAAVHDGMPQLIKELRSAYQTALLSNTTADEVKPLMDRNNLWELFDEVFISADLGLKKPDPAIYQHVLEQLNVRPEEAIFIDDNPKNVAGAASVGIKAIRYTSTEQLREELQRLGVVEEGGDASVQSLLAQEA